MRRTFAPDAPATWSASPRASPPGSDPSRPRRKGSAGNDLQATDEFSRWLRSNPVKTPATTFTGDHTMSATLLRPTSYEPTKSSAAASRSSLPSRRSVIVGRVLTGIVAVLLALDAGVKLTLAKAAVEGSAQLGFTPQQVFIIGVIA